MDLPSISLTKMDPRPISPALEYHPKSSAPNITFDIRPESHIPDHHHPGSMANLPRAPNNSYMGTNTYAPMAPLQKRDVPGLKNHCQYGLHEYISLLRSRQRAEPKTPHAQELESQIRCKQKVVLSDLRSLLMQVRLMCKAAQGNRWRRWFFGGAIASFIPIIRRFFRRVTRHDYNLYSNDTEFAFRRSQGIITYVKETMITGTGAFAKVAFLVFSALYVFSNEVSLRVAKTVKKRLKKLIMRIDRGESDFRESDQKILDGWRWRVLLW